MAMVFGLAMVFIPNQAYKSSGNSTYVQGTYFKVSWNNKDVIALVAGDYYYVCYNNNTGVVYTGVVTATANQTLFSSSINPIDSSVYHVAIAVIKFG